MSTSIIPGPIIVTDPGRPLTPRMVYALCNELHAWLPNYSIRFEPLDIASIRIHSLDMDDHNYKAIRIMVPWPVEVQRVNYNKPLAIGHEVSTELRAFHGAPEWTLQELEAVASALESFGAQLVWPSKAPHKRVRI